MLSLGFPSCQAFAGLFPLPSSFLAPSSRDTFPECRSDWTPSAFLRSLARQSLDHRPLHICWLACTAPTMRSETTLVLLPHLSHSSLMPSTQQVLSRCSLHPIEDGKAENPSHPILQDPDWGGNLKSALLGPTFPCPCMLRPMGGLRRGRGHLSLVAGLLTTVIQSQRDSPRPSAGN